ncbi:hypothetical protein CRG98_022858 [Punica granatum]|uniref:Uncharacterized protein n=1 Tax=Punica granatum TaxID=22663 RepID=A0A2I0JKG7_PUNGR|nr:hypothetical protein CRG98_022858 [Punica granatum]
MALQLTEYDIEYVSCTLVKGQVIADHLVEFPIEDDTLINPDFPDEGILQVDVEEDRPVWKMNFESAINSIESGIDAVLISPNERYYPIAAKVDFPYTNNVAEYEAYILGQQAAIDFKTKNAKLVPYHEYLEELEENFEKISFTYTLRIKNHFANALTMLASMVSITKENLIEPLEIEITKAPSTAARSRLPMESLGMQRSNTFCKLVNIRHLLTVTIGKHSGVSQHITLYRRSFNATLLRCVDENDA